MKLETKIAEILSEYPEGQLFDVCAYELCGNRKEGFDCNDLWRLRRAVTLPDVLEAARGRWEVFKLNYLPKARVCDIKDSTGELGYAAILDVDCVPYLEIRPVTE